MNNIELRKQIDKNQKDFKHKLMQLLLTDPDLTEDKNNEARIFECLNWIYSENNSFCDGLFRLVEDERRDVKFR